MIFFLTTYNPYLYNFIFILDQQNDEYNHILTKLLTKSQPFT